MAPKHHVDLDLLVEYAAGNGPEPVALLVATHLALCPACRTTVDRLEIVGGALLEGLTPSEMEGAALGTALARLDQPPPPQPPLPPDEPRNLPRPLRDLVGQRLDRLRWRRRGWRLREFPVLTAKTGDRSRARLLSIGAGVPVAHHGHGGRELTLVLEGAFTDRLVRFGVGDVAMADERVEHGPIAHTDGPCLCLIVSEGPIRLTGLVGRLFD